jgi:uncharacterized membrane protein YidH (DUF202 family)
VCLHYVYSFYLLNLVINTPQKLYMKAVEEEFLSEEEAKKKKNKKLLQKERIRVAFERLHLAWIRTAVTLLAVGVGAYQYFYERVESGRTGFLKHVTGAQIGILLIIVSFIVLLLATFQHHRSMAKLKENYSEMRYSVGSLLSYFILVLTFSISMMVIFRW